MNEYLKDNLILGDWLENFFGWITLSWGIVIQGMEIPKSALKFS